MSRKKVIQYIGIGTLFLVVVLSVVWWGRQGQMQRKVAEKVLRFHVLANSDSKEDQNLKLLVRDEIGSYMQENMGQFSGKQECEAFVADKILEIERLAEQVVKRAGYSYEVCAGLTRCDFPVKTYGSYTFPAGAYDALRITIGEGKGANWWCVMYPNMCFANSMYQVVDEQSEEKLKEVLSEEEYEAVLASGAYEIRWRILEWLQ